MIISIILVVIIIIIICNLTFRQSNSNDKNKIIKILIRQAARWALAARQDKNVMIAVLHANYGAGYLWAVKDIATDQEIVSATGIDVIKFRDHITATQDFATKRMAKLCPKYAPSEPDQLYLAQVGGDV